MAPSDHMDDYDDHPHDPHGHHDDAAHRHADTHAHPVHGGDHAHPESVVYGTPMADAGFFHMQTGPFTCGIQAQAAILHALTGRNIDELTASVEAAQWGLLTVDGTMPEHIGRWLEMHGIECHVKQNGTFLDIVKELRDGHKVVVDVDSNALWYSSDALQAFHSQSADHAIWLTGVDASDPDHVKVFINDSGRLDGAANVYDLHDLDHVLNHPGFHYVATGHDPAALPEHPAGYDEHHGVFSSLDHFLHDHAQALKAAGLAATLAGARLRRPSLRITPIVPAPQEPAPALAPRALPAPALRLEDMTREERDRALRNL